VAGRLDRRRLTRHGRDVSLLLDVGHNPHAAGYLAQRLRQPPLAGRRLAVFGLLTDKDLDGVVAALQPCIDDWAVAPLPTPRTRASAQLSATLLERGAVVGEYASVAQALAAQCAKAGDADEVLVFGSFYCVAEALAWLQEQVEEKGHGIAG
jgi:dihydrofolate synthase/folylpolyglutamate synthase